jgi:hypothetical protein
MRSPVLGCEDLHLRRPVCRLDLAGVPGSFVCDNGHRYDLARSGYVNLLRGRSHEPAGRRDFPETARVLRRGGWIAAAYPGPEHLRELRQPFDLLGQHGRKSARLSAALNKWIGHATPVGYHREVILDETAIHAVIMMGPNAHYIDPSILVTDVGSIVLTFDISILLVTHMGTHRWMTV